jgi:predicted ArsR family transcriptional regulator
VSTVESPFAAIAVLDDESRRGMFEFIRRSGVPVTRDEAAASVGISRKLAAFHLDKLVAAGLLVAGSARVRRAGRRPKTYEVADVADLQVSIPSRRHDLLAALLVEAVTGQRDGESAKDAAVRAAREHGERLGAERRRSGRTGPERALTMAVTVLEDNGFEPVRRDDGARLRSCPFHPLADGARDLVCGLNHALLTGVVDGLRTPSIEAVLDPAGGECCVALRGASKPAGPAD